MKLNEQAVSGQQWLRANEIIIRNPLNSNPSIEYVQEVVTTIGESNIFAPAGVLVKELDNFEEKFPLVHPETGTVLGETSVADGMLVIYSLYHHLYTQSKE